MHVAQASRPGKQYGPSCVVITTTTHGDARAACSAMLETDKARHRYAKRDIVDRIRMCSGGSIQMGAVCKKEGQLRKLNG